MKSERLCGRIGQPRGAGAFAFIVTRDRRRFFVHFSDVETALLPRANTLVEFTPVATARGFRAVAVRPAEAAQWPEESAMIGRVVEWHVERGFGFLEVDEVPGRVFVHSAALAEQDPPELGDLVEFEVIETERGLRARAARVVKPVEG